MTELTSCCDICGRPLRFALMNIQKFVQDLHNQAHDLDAKIADYERQERRVTACLPENACKVRGQHDMYLCDLKDTVASFNAGFADPYFGKVEVHYPEIAKILKQIRAKLFNSKTFLHIQACGKV